MQQLDFAIVGTGLRAAMLAQELVRVHAKKVGLFLDRLVEHQISREINLGLAVSTRPETLRMMTEIEGDIVPSLTRIAGRHVLSRVHPVIVGVAPPMAQGLAYMYHYLKGMEGEIERLPAGDIKGHRREAIRVRGVRLVHDRLVWPALFDWLHQQGAVLQERTGMNINMRKDGSARIGAGADLFSAHRVVLADEGALLEHGPTEALPEIFQPVSCCAIETDPVAGLNDHLVLGPEKGFWARRQKNGHMKMSAAVPLEEMAGQIRAFLSPSIRPRLNGRRTYRSLRVRDGAPVSGRLAQGGMIGIAGFGHWGAFAAPALARWLCGSSSENEKSFFSRHDPRKDRRPVADIDGAVGEAT